MDWLLILVRGLVFQVPITGLHLAHSRRRPFCSVSLPEYFLCLIFSPRVYTVPTSLFYPRLQSHIFSACTSISLLQLFHFYCLTDACIYFFSRVSTVCIEHILLYSYSTVQLFPGLILDIHVEKRLFNIDEILNGSLIQLLYSFVSTTHVPLFKAVPPVFTIRLPRLLLIIL